MIKKSAPLTDDFQIRTALLSSLTQKYISESNVRVFSEFGVRHGLVRADVVVVNGFIHGYEFKSDLDTLKRLPAQAEGYNLVFDQMTLVVAERHLQKALESIPEWWGVELAQLVHGENLKFDKVRATSKNPLVDKLSVAKLLWREEALQLLESIGAADGVKYKRRAALYEKLAEVLDCETLCFQVRQRLLVRTNWRSDELQKLNDG